MEIQRVFKKITDPIRNEYYKWYHKKTRTFKFENVEVHVVPEVFSPISCNTTTALLRYIQPLDLDHKTVLELGCGTGIISLFADEKKAMVTASDINDVALKELSIKTRTENRTIISVYSDLFENLHFHFDYILINPPYISKQPMTVQEKGKYCGSDFEYFDQLFSQLRVRSVLNAVVLMSLPEEAEIFAICRRAHRHHLKMKTMKVNMIKGERVVVYQVVAEV